MTSFCKVFPAAKVRMCIGLIAVSVIMGWPSRLPAATNNVVGTYAGWPVDWQPLNALNDPNDGLASVQLDFVGSTTNPGAYYAANADYVFFRQRVQAGTVSAGLFHDAHFVLIDLVGQDYNPVTRTLAAGTDKLADYAFTWDSKSNDNAKHGLEMSVRLATNDQWSGVQMDDIDGLNAQKGTNDINGDGRTTDGYLRTIDQQGTTNFGMTTFIDYAVKWSYLKTFTGLDSNQSWRVAFASIPDRTDHNTFAGGDISGGANPGSPVTQGWDAFFTLSTAIELRLCETAGRLFVELRTSDEVVEGRPITLYVQDAAGVLTQIGTVTSLGGSRRYMIPVDAALFAGEGPYTLVVDDESGARHWLPGLMLQAFKAQLTRMDKEDLTLTWASLPGGFYDIFMCTRLGEPWRKVAANIEADGDRCSVRLPTAGERSAFYKVEMQVRP